MRIFASLFILLACIVSNARQIEVSCICQKPTMGFNSSVDFFSLNAGAKKITLGSALAKKLEQSKDGEFKGQFLSDFPKFLTEPDGIAAQDLANGMTGKQAVQQLAKNCRAKTETDPTLLACALAAEFLYEGANDPLLNN